MKRNIFLYFILALSLVVSSCGKENSDVFTPIGTPTGADTNWVLNVTSSSPVEDLKRSLLLQPKLDSFEVSTGATLQFPDGLQVSIPANALVGSGGVAVTGKVQIEAMLVRKKGDIIKVDKPTTSFGRQLISGGEIFVQMKKNGDALTLAAGKKINFKYTDANATPLMKIFYGDESNAEKFNWIQGQDSVFVSTQSNPAYELQASKLRWINCDYFADSIGQRVSIHASLPANFTNANTSVYLVYKEARSVLALYGSAATKKFMSGNLPIGKQVTVVVVSKQGTNSYFLAQQSFTIGLNAPTSLTQVILLNPVPTSLPDIKTFLDTL